MPDSPRSETSSDEVQRNNTMMIALTVVVIVITGYGTVRLLMSTNAATLFVWVVLVSAAVSTALGFPRVRLAIARLVSGSENE